MSCVCTVCGNTFNANPKWRHPTGLCSDDCRKIAQRAAKAKYKTTDKGAASNAKWVSSERRKGNEKRYREQPSRLAAAVQAVKRYLQNHAEAREKKRENDRRYGASEHGKEVNRKARAKYTHTEHGRAVRQATKARRRNAEGSFSADEWIAKKREYGGRCAHCGTTENLTPDHITPLALGGNNYITNIQPLCGSCNSRKGARYVG